jgi:hypothetical protein
MRVFRNRRGKRTRAGETRGLSIMHMIDSVKRRMREDENDGCPEESTWNASRPVAERHEMMG